MSLRQNERDLVNVGVNFLAIVVGALAAACEDTLGAVAGAATQSVADSYRDELQLPRTMA